MRRCALVSSVESLAEAFSADLAPEVAARIKRNRDLGPPSAVPGVRSLAGRRVLDAFRWGFIPSQARFPPSGTHDVHVEIVANKPMYADAFRSRRLVVVADAFYLWQRNGRRHVGYVFRRPEGTPLALAGLWNEWTEPQSGASVLSCSVIVGPPTADAEPVTEQMPIHLGDDELDEWLDPDVTNVDILEAMLQPPPPGTYRRSRMRGSAQTTL